MNKLLVITMLLILTSTLTFAFQIPSHYINITGIDKDELLKSLWENSKPAEFYTISDTLLPDFDLSIAISQLDKDGYADCILGRAIKTNIYTRNLIDPSLYDLNNGVGTFAKVVKKLRNMKYYENKFTFPLYNFVNDVSLITFERDRFWIQNYRDEEKFSDRVDIMFKNIFILYPLKKVSNKYNSFVILASSLQNSAAQGFEIVIEKDMNKVYDLIKEGCDNYGIIKKNKEFIYSDLIY